MNKRRGPILPVLSTGEIVYMLERAGVLRLRGHFALPGGDHTANLIEKSQLFKDTVLMTLLSFAMVRPFVDEDVGVVVGPETGGARFARYAARLLELIGQRDVYAIPAPKSYGGGVETNRGRPRTAYVFGDQEGRIRGRKVLIIEDIIGSGDAARSVVKAVRDLGGEVVGVCALIHRVPVRAGDLDNVPEVHTLLDVTLPSWSAQDCLNEGPCSRGEPLTEAAKE